jgi:hypothetical protein
MWIPLLGLVWRRVRSDNCLSSFIYFMNFCWQVWFGEGWGVTTAKVPSSILWTFVDRFGLEKGEEWRLPKFLHHWRLHLPGWLAKGEDLTLLAPPPLYYKQARLTWDPALFRPLGSRMRNHFFSDPGSDCIKNRKYSIILTHLYQRCGSGSGTRCFFFTLDPGWIFVRIQDALSF